LLLNGVGVLVETEHAGEKTKVARKKENEQRFGEGTSMRRILFSEDSSCESVTLDAAFDDIYPTPTDNASRPLIKQQTAEQRRPSKTKISTGEHKKIMKTDQCKSNSNHCTLSSDQLRAASLIGRNAVT